MHHICQFSLCRLQVESRAIGREVQVWFRVLSFSALTSFQLPLGVLLGGKLGATKGMNFFPLILLHICSFCCNKVTRLLQPCFMVVTTLNYNLVTTFLHPCNKVVISVWVSRAVTVVITPGRRATTIRVRPLFECGA